MTDAEHRHHPWCTEHDPSDVCLGDVTELPHSGAAWLEGGHSPAVVVSLGRRPGSDRRLAELSPTEARAVAAALLRLADQHDPGGSHESAP